MTSVSVRSCLGDLLAPTRGSHCELETDNACWPLQYFPWRMCGTLRKLYPRVGCWLSATGGAVRSTGQCLLLRTQSTVRQYKTKREQKGLCIKKKSMRVRLTHAKDMFCVQLLCFLFIASTNSKPYLTASKAVMPTPSSKIKQPFDFQSTR